ncbi:MAG TPA: NAD-dependent epimerase/dehydratase family protein [Longimicrobiales bacterium]
MTTSRRGFVRTAVVAGTALGIGFDPLSAQRRPLDQRPAQRPGRDAPARRIRLLILGGTGFIGPHQVRYALERGHEVTIFNRGRSAPGMFPGVEELVGDRATADYSALRGRTWDAVIDNSASSATAPQWVREAGAVLRDATEQYLFISTRSVFRDLSAIPATVDAPLWTPETYPNWSEGRPYPYGLAKALAEAEARSVFGDRLTIVRPGLIVGPGDDTDRFTYWPARIDRGGEILAPGDGSHRVQVIDVRDLCDWCVRLAEQRTFGTFMGLGPANGRSMAEMLYGIAAATARPLSWTWVPHEFLQQHRVRPYAEMPVWRPPTPGFEGFARFDLSREVAAGLTYRTLADTTTATLEYHYSRPAERQAQLRAGLTPEREAEVLRAWHASG